MIRVMLDAGHGGKDSGATGNGLLEKNKTLSITLKVGEMLKSHSIQVGYTRVKDVFVGLTERTVIANKFNADIFVSIHINSVEDSSANGIETLYCSNSIEGIKLARAIQNSLITIGSIDRGVKPRGDLTVLARTNMPAALVEVGFISNEKDVKMLINREDEISKLIAEGVLDYLGFESNRDDGSKPSKWAEEDWYWAIKNMITDGTRPRDMATREEVIAMIRRAREIK